MDGRPRTPAELDSILVGLVDRVTGRMRRANRAGRTVVLRLRYRDFTKASRSRTMHGSSATTATILASARCCSPTRCPRSAARGLTLLGVAVTNLDGAKGIQLELPVEPPHRPSRRLRGRRGQEALRLRCAAARVLARRRGHGTDSLDAEPSSP